MNKDIQIILDIKEAISGWDGISSRISPRFTLPERRETTPPELIKETRQSRRAEKRRNTK